MKKKKVVRTKKEKTKKVDSSSSMSPSTKEEYNQNNNIDSHLSEDAMTDIFLRLPFESILKARYVSKSWFSLLTNPTLIMSWMRYNAITLPPWYLFRKLDCPINNSVSIVSPDRYSKLLLPKLDGFSFKFIPSKPIPPKTEEENIYLLASSNGLVLGLTKIYYEHRYFVCNPLTKQLVLLPLHYKAKVNSENIFHGFFCESSSSLLTTETTNYNVVRIQRSGMWMEYLNLEIFSSTTSKWERHRIHHPENVGVRKRETANVVGSFGVLYWIERLNNIFAYDLSNNNNSRNGTVSKCRLINLPNRRRKRSDNYCLGKSSKGLVVYAEFAEEELNVWELEDNFNTGSWTWHLVHNIHIMEMLPENTEDRLFEHMLCSYCFVANSLKPLALNLVDQNVIIFGSLHSIYAYNMETRIIKLLIRNDRSNSSRVSPFVLAPWPTTFRSPFHQ